MAERGITGRGRANLSLPLALDNDGQKSLPVGGVHALCHGQHPSTIVDSVRVYNINALGESITPTCDIIIFSHKR